jgi:hypothetical protein
MRTTFATAVSPVSSARVRRPPKDELRSAIQRLLQHNAGARRVVSFVSRPLSYASSFAIEDITVHFDDDTRMELVCKDTSAAAMLPEARRIKPTFLRNPLREIAAYAAILEPLRVDAPFFHGAIVDPSRDRYWLFLERVQGSPLAEIGDFNVWLQASAWLAALHTDIYPERVPSIVDVPLLRYDRAFYRRWMQRAERFVLESSTESRARRACMRWLASRYDHVLEHVTASPVTFVHGEFYASNILVEDTGRGARIRPLDWELSGIGFPLMDLAALTAGWGEAEQSELTFSYYSALTPKAPGFLPPDAFIRALDCCRVILAVQCLGWADRWVPPKQHSRDWLQEALVAAERLGL